MHKHTRGDKHVYTNIVKHTSTSYMSMCSLYLRRRAVIRAQISKNISAQSTSFHAVSLQMPKNFKKSTTKHVICADMLCILCTQKHPPPCTRPSDGRLDCIYIYVCVYIYIHIYVCVCVCMYIYIYII